MPSRHAAALVLLGYPGARTKGAAPLRATLRVVFRGALAPAAAAGVGHLSNVSG